MKSNLSKEFWIGTVIGLLTPAIALVLVSIGFSFTRNQDPFYFLQEAVGVKGLQANLLKLALVFNLVPFFIFMQKGKMRHCYGVLFVTLIFAFILIFYYLV